MANAYNYSNVANPTTLAGNISAGATTISVLSTAGFPTVPYVIAIDFGASTEELMKVTSVAGLALTGDRGFGGTSAQTHSLGAVVRPVYNAVDATDFRSHEDSTAAHGVTGAVVGTTNAQTLTNKTLTSPTVNGAALSGTLSGSPTLSGNPSFSGTPTFTNVSISGDITGNPDVTGNLRVEGVSGGAETLAVFGGAGQAQDLFLIEDNAGLDLLTVPVSNPVNIANGLEVANLNPSRFHGDLQVDGLLDVASDLNVDLTLTVAGTSTFNGAIGGTGIGTTQRAYKTADTSRTATTVLADPHLTASVVNGRVYIVEALLLVRGDSAADINIGFSGGTAHSGLWAPINFAVGTSTNSGSPELVASAWNIQRSLGLNATGTTNYGYHIRGTLIATATGTFSVDWGAFVGGGTGTIMTTGSHILLTRIA